jgi:hypothetical protein
VFLKRRCDRTPGSHLYGAVTARFGVGSHDWELAEATFDLPPDRAALRTVSFYAIFRGHEGAAYFSDLSLSAEAAAPARGHTIFISYNAGGTTAACPGGCPETNAFGLSNYSNAAFSPYLDLQTEAVGLYPLGLGCIVTLYYCSTLTL